MVLPLKNPTTTPTIEELQTRFPNSGFYDKKASYPYSPLGALNGFLMGICKEDLKRARPEDRFPQQEDAYPILLQANLYLTACQAGFYARRIIDAVDGANDIQRGWMLLGKALAWKPKQRK